MIKRDASSISFSFSLLNHEHNLEHGNNLIEIYSQNLAVIANLCLTNLESLME